MAHLSGRGGRDHRALARRLISRSGDEAQDLLTEIVALLFTGEEARLGTLLPLEPTAREDLAAMTGMEEAQLGEALEEMALRGLVVETERKGRAHYRLAPPVVGFFEHVFMRVGDPQQPRLARLMEEFLVSEGVREELLETAAPLFRALVHEESISAVDTAVLTHQRASRLVQEAGYWALSACSCRHRARHLGKACGGPMEEACISLGEPARWLVRRGFARPAQRDEILVRLEEAARLGLVLLSDSVLDRPAFICRCCACCCLALRAVREEGIRAVRPSRLRPRRKGDCSGCGACRQACQVAAVAMEGGEPRFQPDRCLGCGLCAHACPHNLIAMRPEMGT